MVKKVCFLLLIVSASFNVFSQGLYDSLLYELNSKYPQEKIHVQLDKSYYATGETIWFKAYLVTGNVPSIISTNFYAELINERGMVLQRKTMPIFQGSAASHFDLPDSMQFSKLYLRAYTSWMLNSDSSSLYIKPLNIIKAASAERQPANPASFTLTFFPEGGDIIEDVQCRIAFKTNDQDGKPFPVSGIITGPSGKNLGSFKSSHNGMGYFSIILKAGEIYKALWKDTSGITHETPLPAVKTGTAALSINQGNGLLFFTLTRPENVTEYFKEYVVVAQMHQETKYVAKINMKVKTSISAQIPTDSLPDGIMQITVFNGMQVPVAERIVFINHGNYSFITDLHLAEKNIKPRGKNVLQIDVGGKFTSNLSVSVTDADLNVTGGSRENIFSQLLLTEDLRGYVYDPAYYFSSDEDSVKQQLDLVMMTNGWRRFNWEKLLANQWPVIKYPPDNYLSIAGKVFGIPESRLLGKSLTGVLKGSANGGNSILFIPIDKDGSFKSDGNYFFDTVKLFYQVSADKNKYLTTTGSFSFKDAFVKYPPVYPTALLSLPPAPQLPTRVLLKSLRQNELFLSEVKGQKIKLLETVTVVAKQKSKTEVLDKEYSSGMFTGGNARIFATEDDPFASSALNVFEYLRNKVPGMQITIGGANGSTITRRGSRVETFLDQLVTDAGSMESIPMSDVVLIKVFDPPFFGATGGGAGGAVAVYTRRGGGSATIQGLNSATLYGYSPIKQFYVPDYENPVPTMGVDYRSTLYWNPFVLLDAGKRRVTFPFYNNEHGKKLRVVIEGMNELGQLTREEKFFE